MKTENDNYIFESTGRKFSTHGTDNISVTEEGQVKYGYDGYVNLKDDEGDDDPELEFTVEERNELAQFMIKKWNDWAKNKSVSPATSNH